MPLYHCEVGFPVSLKLPRGAFFLRYSKHAEQAGREEGIYSSSLPAYIDTRQAKPIEVETDSQGNAVKVVYRMGFPQKQGMDIVLVVLLKGYLVKTLWLNSQSDSHVTLRRSLYTHPSEYAQ